MEKALVTKYIISGVIAVLVVVGGAVLYAKDKTVTSQVSAPTASSVVQPGSGSSLKDLLAKTTPTKCTVSSTNDTSDASGVVYVANGKMRSDFTSTMKNGNLAGKVVVAHMIVDADTSYMWGDGEMKMGIKMARQSMLEVNPDAANTPQSQAAMDMNEKSDYHCDGWTADEALFTPPANVQFQDMSKMMQPTQMETGASTGGRQQMTAEQMSQMCGACDNAGESKAQCRAALGCK